MAHRRSAHRLPNPQNMDEFQMQLESNRFSNLIKIGYHYFYHGRIGFTDEEGITLVFVTPHVRNIFRSSQDFFIDRTFHAVPYFGGQCQQLFVLMGIHFDVGFPLVFALMSRKTEQAYAALFVHLKTIEPTWQPKNITMDFEPASINAVRSVFPTTRILGCWFHSCKCVWRKIKELGLANLYSTNRKVHDCFRMVMAIPLLPQENFVEGFNEVKNFYFKDVFNSIGSFECHKFIRFFAYYSRLTGTFADLLSVSNQNQRTNNVLEISHMKLMRYIRTPNPSPWLFLEMLVTYTSGVVTDYLLAIDGVEVRQSRPRMSQEKVQTINIGLRRLEENRFSVAEFLAYCKRVPPNFGVQRPDANNAEPQEQLPNNAIAENRIVEHISNYEGQLVPRQIIESRGLPQVPIRRQNDEEQLEHREILGYESPPQILQDFLQHHNLPLMEPIPVYELRPRHVRHEAHRVEVLPQIHIRRRNDEVENMREVVVCVGCMSVESNVVLRPCNHTCLCGGCFERLEVMLCPLCRESITEIIVIQD